MKKLEVTKDNIEVRLRVYDDDGNIGTIKECSDLHNVLVKHDSGDESFYCLITDCIDNGLPHYDPLYLLTEEYKFNPLDYGFEPCEEFPPSIAEYFGADSYFKVTCCSGFQDRPDLPEHAFWFSVCKPVCNHDDRWQFYSGVYDTNKPREMFDGHSKPHVKYSGVITTDDFARQLLIHIMGSAYNKSISCGADRLDDDTLNAKLKRN